MKIKELEKKYAESLKVKDYDKDDIALELGLMVAEARIRSRLTQKELAKEIGTKQPSIARIENGSSLVSNTLLIKIAKALNIKFTLPKFDFDTKVKAEAKATEDIFKEVTLSPVPYLKFFISATNRSINKFGTN